MHDTIESWIRDLSELTDEARASEEFQAWLDVHSRFHEYSFRNTLLIKQQCPDATKVAGYRAWQTEFDRHVQAGESAIWIWAPIITERCPTCHESRRWHEESGCRETTPTEEWERGVVGFKPVPVFDASQTEGEPLPALETMAYGDGKPLLARLLECARALGVEVRLIDEQEWPLGNARGACQYRGKRAPLVFLKRSDKAADMASTLIHEYAHALLHMDRSVSRPERAKREVEAESVAYVVGRHFGLEVDNSALYIARWADDESEVLTERLERISKTAQQVIASVEKRFNSIT
nr:ImmA/IrrE family metallo-endopeptidase [Halomarina rubra]